MAATPVDEVALYREKLRSFVRGRVSDLTLPNEIESIRKYYPESKDLNISVVDSWLPPVDTNLPIVAMLFIPSGRQHDWMYTTQIGLRRLLYTFSNLTRMIVVKPTEDSTRLYDIDEASCLPDGAHKELAKEITDLCLQVDPILLTYEAGLKYAMRLFECGDFATDMYVEDVIRIEGLGTMFRRQMRYKEIPHLFQADCLLVATRDGNLVNDVKSKDLVENKNAFVITVDIEKLVPPMQAMVYGLTVIHNHLTRLLDSDAKVSVMSLGSGVCILERVFKSKFDAEVLGVEIDVDLMTVAKMHFNSSVVDEWDGLNVISGLCASDVISQLAGKINDNSGQPSACTPHIGKTFDVIVLDILDYDKYPDMGACAPPRGFIDQSTFLNIESLLNEGGALVVNAIVPDYCFERNLMAALSGCFEKVFKINLDHPAKFVLVATNLSSYACGEEQKDDRALKIINSLVTRAFNIDAV